MKLPHHFVAISAALALTGCGSSENSSMTIPALLSESVGLGAEDSGPALSAEVLRTSLTPQAVAEIGTPIALVEFQATQRAAVLSFVETNQGVATYLSEDGVSFSFRDGALIATRGLGFDLMNARLAAGSLRAVPQGRTSGERVHAYLTGENRIIQRRFNCTLDRSGPDIVETCSDDGQSFANQYRIDASGRVIDVVQWISPQNGSVRVNFYGVP